MMGAMSLLMLTMNMGCFGDSAPILVLVSL